MQLLNKAAILILTGYEKGISPFLPRTCRFYPTCSDYARQAFQKRSFFRACYLTLSRIIKCNPLHNGGYDPLE